MTDLNDFHYTDGVHDVLAAYVNRLLGSTLRSEYKNVEALAADRHLTNADAPIQNYDGDGSSWNVVMPDADAVNNHPFLIVNGSAGAEVITVLKNDEVTVLKALDPGEMVLCLPDGAGDYGTISASSGGGGGGLDENAVTSLIMAFG